MVFPPYGHEMSCPAIILGTVLILNLCPRAYALLGPLKIRAGSKMIPFTSSSTPSTAIPMIRNGKSSSHTIG